MKEAYFTQQNINSVSLSIIEEIKKYSAIKNLTSLSDKTALLVLDMQEYFTDESSHAFVPSAMPVTENINALINCFTGLNLPVIFTKHINTETNSGLMNVWWSDILSEENKYSGLSGKITGAKENVIIKSSYDAFYNTELESILTENNIKQLVVTGVMTHLCCEHTARSAFIRGYEVIFPVDTTAAYNRGFHVSALMNLSHGYAYIPLHTEVLKLFNEKKNK